MVLEGILDGDRVLHGYTLHAFAILGNHVHLLITPHAPVSVLKSLEGTTSRRANQILNRTGTRFWQDESHDHWVRNAREFARILAYIEENPVRADLATSAEEYPWSSAGVKKPG